MKSRIFAVITLGILLLTACSGGGSSAKKSTAAIEKFQSASGLALASCGFSNWKIRFFDPATGKQNFQLTEDDIDKPLDKADSATSGKIDKESPCSDAQVFSPDRTKMAVTIKNFSDDSKHVGWVNLRDGALTDITKDSVGSGFSREIPDDDHPRFGPDGSFWFRRDDDTLMVKNNSTKPVDGRQSDACSRFFSGDFQVVGNVATTCDFPHPNGNFAVSHSGETLEFHFLNSTTNSNRLSDDSLSDTTAATLEVKTVAGGRPYSCKPVTWIGDSKLLCVDGDDDHDGYRLISLPLASIKPGAGLTTLTAGPLFIPATDRDVLLVTVSPDEKQVLIVTKAGDDAPELYRISVSNPQAPELVSKLSKDQVDNGTKFFDWR